MKIISKKTLLLAISAGIAGLSLQAQATNGYFAHGYGIKSKGMAGAGVALAQDSIASATNPAAMVHLGNRWDVGGEIFAPDREARTAWGSQTSTNTVTTYDGNGSGFGESWFLVPELGYNRMIDNNMSFGVSVFGNGGMNTSYSDQIFSASTGGSSTSIDLMQLFVSPTISLKLDDKNSIGVAVNLVYQRFEAKGLSDFCSLKPSGCGNPNAGLTNQGYDSSYGISFRFGWIGELTDTVSAGFSYQPKTNMKPLDKYNELFAESGDFDIPANYTIGLSWAATPKMTLAFDIQEIKYSHVKSIANVNNGFTGGQLGTTNGPGFGWDDMTIYKLGANFQVNKDLVVRAGYSHGNQPIPSSETLFNVIAPAVIEDHLTLGFTWAMKDGGELSGYYMHAFEETVNGTGVVAFPGAQNAGAADISMSQNAFGIAYGKKF